MLDGVSPATIAFPLFNFALRAFQTAFDLSSVPAETKDLLGTIAQVTSYIKNARELRRRKGRLLDQHERRQVDDAIENTELAMGGLEGLVEPARVDMSTNFGRVGGGSRVMWVLRDSTKVNAALGRLMIASQGLQTQISMMNGKIDTSIVEDPLERPTIEWRRNVVGIAREPGLERPPPTYQATMDMLYERRQVQRRDGRTSAPPPIIPHCEPDHPAPPLPSEDETGMLASLNNFAEFHDYIRANEMIMSPSGSDRIGVRSSLIQVTLADSQIESQAMPIFGELESRTPTPFMVSHTITAPAPNADPLPIRNPPSSQPPAYEEQQYIAYSRRTQSPQPILPPTHSPPYPDNNPRSTPNLPSESSTRHVPANLLPRPLPYEVSLPGLTEATTRSRLQARPYNTLTASSSIEPLLPTALRQPAFQPGIPSRTTTMESETLIAGHSRPMTLRWNEPSTTERISSPAPANRSVPRLSPQPLDVPGAWPEDARRLGREGSGADQVQRGGQQGSESTSIHSRNVRRLDNRSGMSWLEWQANKPAPPLGWIY